MPRYSLRGRSGARHPRHAHFAARGCGWLLLVRSSRPNPIPSAACRGAGAPGRDGKAGVPIELESWISDVAERTMLSRSGLSVTAVTGVQFRVCRLQRLGCVPAHLDRPHGGPRAEGDHAQHGAAPA